MRDSRNNPRSVCLEGSSDRVNVSSTGPVKMFFTAAAAAAVMGLGGAAFDIPFLNIGKARTKRSIF